MSTVKSILSIICRQSSFWTKFYQIDVVWQFLITLSGFFSFSVLHKFFLLSSFGFFFSFAIDDSCKSFFLFSVAVAVVAAAAAGGAATLFLLCPNLKIPNHRTQKKLFLLPEDQLSAAIFYFYRYHWYLEILPRKVSKIMKSVK